MGIEHRAATDDATAADADDGAAAANAARDATWYETGKTGKHGDATATVRHAKSVRADLLTGKGRLYSE